MKLTEAQRRAHDWLVVRRQMDGICVGIILCAWWVDASSEQVALIRAPATLFLGWSILYDTYRWVRRSLQQKEERG